ncbi:MAG: hypothetical protein ACR2J5_17370 [Geodermatophilaceae bacterium]
MSNPDNNGSGNTALDNSESQDTSSLVFPVGHYMGPFHPSRNGPAKHHIVRVDWETPKLPDEGHVDIWALAHGLPTREDVRWTRRAIIEAADEAGMPDATAILDNLASLGLIAEVTPGTEQAHEFANSYRLQSLLIGLGNSPDDPLLDGIGLMGLAPVVKVRPRCSRSGNGHTCGPRSGPPVQDLPLWPGRRRDRVRMLPIRRKSSTWSWRPCGR